MNKSGDGIVSNQGRGVVCENCDGNCTVLILDGKRERVREGGERQEKEREGGREGETEREKEREREGWRGVRE